MEIVSVHLPFQGIQNCRDMAGIPNKEGKVIKPGLLYRSANLHRATDQDLYTLQEMGLENIVDLRTTMEIDMEPDRLLERWKTHFLPIVQEAAMAKSQGGQFSTLEEALENTAQLLTNVYPELVMTDHAIEEWKHFFSMLLNQPGSYLWHCTQGKDRTGMAAILLLTALDVEDSLIEADYLQTNLYLAPDLAKDEEVAKALLGKHAGHADKDLSALQQARPAYYDAAKHAVEQKYGSWKGYLTQALGLKQSDFEQLQSFYME